ncbi:hypothetical protein DSCO28_21920 [Desulfosarcina ovata subsp. sediminis]|uniref:Uncharacterized protein n=1 Tax=Desulfosarcina ovata subsp. sediminis TaxID=885957 RepID=A0A5K7ZKQ7_9BACT|nr:hypothetical protein DSCO28_21920 [Desulfosarcina ovata subsp. sediminis]
MEKGYRKVLLTNLISIKSVVWGGGNKQNEKDGLFRGNDGFLLQRGMRDDQHPESDP